MNKRLLISMMLMLVMGQVWAANSNHFTKLQTTVSTKSSGLGLVYASDTKSDEGAEYKETSESKTQGDTESEDKPFKFYAYAKPNSEDIHFLGWSKEDDGDIISSASPYEVVIIAPNSAGINTETWYANFLKKVECTHTFVKSQGTVTVSDGTNELTAPGKMTTREELTLTASDVDGKDFLGWYYMNNGRKYYFSFEQKVKTIFTDGKAIGADYIDKGVAAYYIKETGEMYTDFNYAVSVAAKCNGTVVVAHDGTLAKGAYTIPENVTLLIPFDSKFTCYKDDVEAVFNKTELPIGAFRTLNMEEGTVLKVNGDICVSAKLNCSNGGTHQVCGGVYDYYGCIKMSEGSRIELNKGSNMYAWGYIIGDGNVIAKDGSNVFESFQLMDFRGGTGTLHLMDDYSKLKIFPINQYYVQNIEVPMTFYHGALENVITSCWVSKTQSGNVDAQIFISNLLPFIGTGGFFELANGTTLTKKYDGKSDRQLINVSGDLTLGDISLSLLGYTATSSSFVMPITNNMTITVEDGTLSYTNKNGISLLPGANITIKNNAIFKADKGSIYIYDSENWAEYACYYKLRPLEYVPTRTYERSEVEDAILDIQGVLETDSAFVYTTTGNANICCSNGFGMIKLGHGAGDEKLTYQAKHFWIDDATVTKIDSISITPAKLYNAKDGSYTETKDAVAETVYHYVHGRWQTEEMSGLLGDVDGDGDIDKDDVDTLWKKLLGMVVESFNEDNADVDNNGKISIGDVARLIEMVK